MVYMKYGWWFTEWIISGDVLVWFKQRIQHIKLDYFPRTFLSVLIELQQCAIVISHHFILCLYRRIIIFIWLYFNSGAISVMGGREKPVWSKVVEKQVTFNERLPLVLHQAPLTVHVTKTFPVQCRVWTRTSTESEGASAWSLTSYLAD